MAEQLQATFDGQPGHCPPRNPTGAEGQSFLDDDGPLDGMRAQRRLNSGAGHRNGHATVFCEHEADRSEAKTGEVDEGGPSRLDVRPPKPPTRGSWNKADPTTMAVAVDGLPCIDALISPTVPEAWSKRLRCSQSLAKAAAGSRGAGRRTWSTDRSNHVGNVAGPSIIGAASPVAHHPCNIVGPEPIGPALSEQPAFVEPQVGGTGHAWRFVTVGQQSLHGGCKLPSHRPKPDQGIQDVHSLGLR